VHILLNIKEMTFRSIFFLFLALLFSCTTSKIGKEQKLLLVKSNRAIKILPSQFEVDKLGNIYVVNVLGNIQMFDAKGQKKYEFADKRLGKITSFDVSNPLNILVYFKEQGIVKILDNTLSEVKMLNLLATGKFTNAGPIALANDKNIWIYDAQLQKILKLDPELKPLVETNQFNDLGKAKFIPTKIIERNNLLAVSSESDGILIFDNFGQMTKSFDVIGIKDFQFDGSNLLIQTMTGLKSQSIDYPAFLTLGLPSGISADKILQAKIENKKWYFSFTDGIDWYDKK
jgi:hypothetical protein